LKIEKKVTGHGLVKHREWRVNLNCLSADHKRGSDVICKAPCCPRNEILYRGAQFLQSYYGRFLFLTHKAYFTFKWVCNVIYLF